MSTRRRQQVEGYKEITSRKSALERTELQKEKVGVFSSCYARNPANGKAIPIWIADYVLGSYGTGAIMAVPAQDTRDHEFSLKYNIPLCGVVTPDDRNFSYFERAYIGEGDFKLRDWLFTRQRYWGELIPINVLDDTGECIPVSEAELPLTLPELDDFTPTETGEPPLAKALSWEATELAKKARELKRAADGPHHEERSGNKGRKWQTNVKSLETEVLLLEEDVKALEEMYPRGEKAEATWAMTVLGYLAKLVLRVVGSSGTAAFAFFCFYLLLAVIAGAMMLGLKLVFITIHPMKWGATLMNSFLFSVGLILLCSIRLCV